MRHDFSCLIDWLFRYREWLCLGRGEYKVGIKSILYNIFILVDAQGRDKEYVVQYNHIGRVRVKEYIIQSIYIGRGTF